MKTYRFRIVSLTYKGFTEYYIQQRRCFVWMTPNSKFDSLVGSGYNCYSHYVYFASTDAAHEALRKTEKLIKKMHTDGCKVISYHTFK